jgi:6-phosphofructokinase 1
MRVLIVTGGGDAPGLNAILRAFVHASRTASIEVLGCRDGLEGLLDPARIVPLGIEDVRGILPRGGSILGCSTRTNPFYVREKGSEDAPIDLGPPTVERLRADGIDALALIGGDGTMVAASRFARIGMPTVGIPKTIDKDLGETEATCGFDTAVTWGVRAIDALHSTAEAHSRVMIVEVMGRSAGFIALTAGVAAGADVILIPELPYRVERVVQKIRERESLGRRFTIVVISEGARPAGGDVLEVEGARPGHLARLGGAGERLVRQLEAADLGHEVRLTVLGHVQRGGSPSPFDRTLGTQLGAHGAQLCAEGRFGRMVVWRAGCATSVPLPSPADEGRLHARVDLNGPLVDAARRIGIELG